MGANQNARKVLSTDLVNTNNNYRTTLVTANISLSQRTISCHLQCFSLLEMLLILAFLEIL